MSLPLACTQEVDDLAALERFVVENDDLLSLESLIGRFNIFDALDIARMEIRHSNFLAFILDPAESHGLGQLFLKAVLMDMLKHVPANLRPLSPIELDGTDLRGVEIRREWAHIDLLITCKQPSFVVVIENKVGSQEHSDQLKRYPETMKEHYPNDQPAYVYLTPNADEPSEPTWIPYSYEDIHRVLARIRSTYHKSIGDDILVFLDYYLSLIGTRFMDNPEIDNLCQQIYKNHRRALKLIYDRVGSPASAVLAEAEGVLKEDARWHMFYRAGTGINFVPKSWLDWLPAIGLDRKDEPKAWFVLRFELYAAEGKLDLYVEVGRIADVVKRRAIVDLLVKERERFGFKRSTGRIVKDSYTRVSGREPVSNWNKDENPDPKSIRDAVKKKLNEIFPKLEDIPSTLTPLITSSNSGTT